MGISVLSIYDFEVDRIRLFDDYNLEQGQLRLNTAALRVSFNGVGFDDKVMAKTGKGYQLRPEGHYDILYQLLLALKIDPAKFNPLRDRVGGLDAISRATLGYG